MPLRTIVMALLLLLGIPVAHAEPLDLRDPTPRTVRVQFENSAADAPGRLDASWGTPLVGSFRPGPRDGLATVVVPARSVESLMANYEPVSDTFTDFVWVFETESGHVLSAGFEGVVRSEVDLGWFGREVETRIRVEMGTRRRAGFREPKQRLGHTVFAYCETKGETRATDPETEPDAEVPECRGVPAAPLDPKTGYVNAVGWIDVDAIAGYGPRSYSPMGEAIFVERGVAPVALEPPLLGFSDRAGELDR